MDLGFNETQQMLKNSAREFLSRSVPIVWCGRWNRTPRDTRTSSGKPS